MDVTRRDFLSSAKKAADKEHRNGLWEVWTRYGIRQHEQGGRYIVATEPRESDLPPKVGLAEALEKTNGTVRPGSHEEALLSKAMERTAFRKPTVYSPLADYPDLFLKFARLAEEEGLEGATESADELDTDKNADVALGWAEKYGVLGLTFEEKHELWASSARGGTADTVSAFAAEAWTANACLRLYETATARQLDTDFIAAHMPNRRKAIDTATPAAMREWAWGTVARATQEHIRGNAYPALYGWVGSLTQGWAFMNLLGAMWLQMFWLLTAAEASRRCANPECDKIVAMMQPDQSMQGTKRNDRSMGYRTREDKAFCNKKCINRHYYLTKTKPRRQAARNAP